ALERDRARTGQVSGRVHRRVEGRRHTEDADHGGAVGEAVGEVAARRAVLGDGVAVGLAEGAFGARAAAVALTAGLAGLRAGVTRSHARRVGRARNGVPAAAARTRRGVLADLAGVDATQALPVAARALDAAHVEVVAEAAEHPRLGAGVARGLRVDARRQRVG